MAKEYDPDDKRPFSARLRPEAFASLEKLAKDWGISQTAVVESLLISVASHPSIASMPPFHNLALARKLMLDAIHIMETSIHILPISVEPQSSPRGRKPSNKQPDTDAT